MNKYLSIITLNVNGLNAPIKRHRITEWIRKHDPHICCLKETHLRTKNLHRLKVKGQKQISQANGQEKKAGVAILISGKIDFKKRAIKRGPDGHFIILKKFFEGCVITPQFHIFKKTQNTNSKKYMHLYVHCSIIYNSQDMGAT